MVPESTPVPSPWKSTLGMLSLGVLAGAELCSEIWQPLLDASSDPETSECSQTQDHADDQDDGILFSPALLSLDLLLNVLSQFTDTQVSGLRWDQLHENPSGMSFFGT